MLLPDATHLTSCLSFISACVLGRCFAISLIELTSAFAGLDLPVHGDGQSTRSYLYVEDVAEAYITILHKGNIGETYNIGTQQERTVTSVAEDLGKFFNVSQDMIVNVKDRAFNDRRYFICDKKLAMLGWKEKHTWEQGLQKTIDWYLKHGLDAYWEHGDVEVALRPHPGAAYVSK